jgi:hypothetical protein
MTHLDHEHLAQKNMVQPGEWCGHGHCPGRVRDSSSLVRGT